MAHIISPQQILIFGCGYLGRRAARLWREAGAKVHAVTRSPQRAEQFQAEGLEPLVADIASSGPLPPLPQADVVLFAVGYDRGAGRPMREVYVEGFRRVLEALPEACGKLIYISSTGVYGDTEGEWVNEDSPCRPTREGGRLCLEAEELLRTSPFGPRSLVLRLAGIYGPGRLPRLDALRAGEPLAVPSEGWLNLIHVDDAARIILAAAEQLEPPAIYVVSDGAPVQRSEYLAELARLIGAPSPRFTEPDPQAAATQRAGSDKRIDPSRLRAALSLELEYPDHRAGLAAAVGET